MHREKKLSIGDQWDNFKQTDIHVIESLKEKRERN